MLYDDNTGKTVAALSTPRAAGGIAVIRISGDRSREICDRVFRCISCDKKPSEMEGYTCAYGNIVSAEGEVIDDGVITVYRSPRSYTGEDVAEISCHGGVFVSERVLRRIYEEGAFPAAAGEFTKRAYLNGKMSLTQAEAVMDIIGAEGAAFCRRSVGVREGSLFKRIRSCSGRLLKILGQIGAWVDYPEEDIPGIGNDELISELKSIREEFIKISHGYDNGAILRSGIDTVIAGKPNVGKSTLMNFLAGYEKSIVTDIAGTTRDIVEESIRLGDIVLRLSDTAGLRSSGDVIEEIGIKRAEKKLEGADLIIAVFDNSVCLDDDDRRLFELVKGCENKGVKIIACINKSDKASVIDRSEIENVFERVIDISAESGDGIDKFQAVLKDMFIDMSGYDDITVNERQKICLDRAVSSVSEAIEAVEAGVTLDAVEVVIEEAQSALLELTGERVSEAVVNEVFSHFCVGK